MAESKRRNLTPDLERLRAAWLKPSISNLSEFFHVLAKAAKESFDANLVTIWDNNVYGDCLVFLGAEPGMKHSHYTIPRKHSFTGLAVERCEITQHDNLSARIGDFEFFDTSIIDEANAAYMISIPVPNAFNPQLVTFVINLYFDQAVDLNPEDRHALSDWVVRALALSLDYQLLKVDDMIRQVAEDVSISASGRSGLFEGIYEELQRFIQCDGAALLLWDAKKTELNVERTFPMNSEQEHKEHEKHIELLTEECIRRKRSVMVPIKRDPRKINAERRIDSQWMGVMATPIYIWSKPGEPSGALQCLQKEDTEAKRSFSSLDMYVLESFARSIGPSVERFSKLPEKSVLMAVVDKVSAAAVQANDLGEILQCTMETLTESLNTAVGSIYLLEDANDGSKELVMRAATGVHRKLIGQAKYKIGEGITGDIASGGGKLLNFKTLAERRSYPAYEGKYNFEDRIEEGYRETPGFLGVPIQRDGQVLGVWKIEYLRPSGIHTDSYFTDEDEQMARVLSSFLAYIIENDRYKRVKAQEFSLLEKEFKLLGESSVAIQAKKTEDDAILEMMVALEKSGWKNALLCLYDSSTNQIVGKIGAGEWRDLAELTRRDINSEHILAQVLREGEPGFFEDASKNKFDQKLVSMVKAKAIYVLPMHVGNELIGTLGVDMGAKTAMNEEEALLLQVFANHLSLAISRIRSINKSIELTDQVISRSRFIVAETLSGVAVHSLNRTLEQILRGLGNDLRRPEIRARREVREPLERWQRQLKSEKQDLENALKIVRASADDKSQKLADLNPLVQQAIDTWFGLLSQSGCEVHYTLEAKWSHCRFSPHAFGEIMSVLLVNSVQAFANSIDIKTYNLEEIDLPMQNYVSPAFCLAFSDDGAGIQTNDAEDIFEPTYTTKPDKFGTGLGLFIARTLARRGGGDLIAVLPNPRKKGATFHLYLPVVQVSS